MSKGKTETARTSVKVRGQLLTLPNWLGENASQRVIEKAVALLETHPRKIAIHGYEGTHMVYGRVTGSQGEFHRVHIRKGKHTCNCTFGVFNPSGFCYHQVALFLNLLLFKKIGFDLPKELIPLPCKVIQYEDDFELD